MNGSSRFAAAAELRSASEVDPCYPVVWMGGVDDNQPVAARSGRRRSLNVALGKRWVEQCTVLDRNPGEVRVQGAVGAELAVADVGEDDLARLGHAFTPE